MKAPDGIGADGAGSLVRTRQVSLQAEGCGEGEDMHTCSTEKVLIMARPHKECTEVSVAVNQGPQGKEEQASDA